MNDSPIVTDDNHHERGRALRFRQSLDREKAYECKDCGRKIYLWKKKDDDDALILHHIIQIVNGGMSDRNNMVKLCNKCHKQRHEALKVKPELPLFRKRKVVGYGKGIVHTLPR